MKILFIFAFIYLLLVVVMAATQRNFLYFPDKNIPSKTASGVTDMQDITVETEDGLTITSWFKPPENSRPIIILFHGNGGNIAMRGFKARYFLDRGYGFILANYRGYAGAPGKPSEEGFYKDARAVIDWAQTRGYVPSDIILYGESLGTGVAIQMAKERPGFKALLLEAPYASMARLAQIHMPFIPGYWLLWDRYESINKIADIRTPQLFLHGNEDRTIPIAEARRLYDKATEPKKFVTYNEGGHNNLYESGVFDEMRSFLEGLDGAK